MAVETIVGFFRETQDEQQLTWPFKMDHGNRNDVNRMITGDQAREPARSASRRSGPALPRHGHDVVSTLFLDDAMIVGHVGDSRALPRAATGRSSR